MISAHTTAGVATLALMLACLGVKYLRTPKHRPFRAWGWIGLAGIVCAESLLFLGEPWVATYFTPIVWTSYLLLVDALVLQVRGNSRLSAGPAGFLVLAFWSVPLWLIFEAYNLRLENWTYVGLPGRPLLRDIGYIWSFATIWPAIYETTDFLQALGIFRKKHPVRADLARFSHLNFMIVGLVLLTVPVFVPVHLGRYLFGAVWAGFIFLLEPLNYRWGGRSPSRDLEMGATATLNSLLMAGLVCGILWEFWNHWARAKWLYVFPIAQHAKVFEMPLPGYLGFPPFALECFVMYEFLRSARNRLGGLRRFRKWEAAESPSSVSYDASQSCRGNLILNEATKRTCPAGSTILVALALTLAASPAIRAIAADPHGQEAQDQELALRGVQLIMDGDLEGAIKISREIQRADLDSPLGYLIEAEATWWRIYYRTGDLIDPDVFDVVSAEVTPYDSHFEGLISTAIQKAEKRIFANQDVARNYLYEGLAYALRARLAGLRGHDRATARAGKKMRALLLRALQLDPSLIDAYLGTGIYNYFVDTLPLIVKVLRVFMAIPGGSREVGLQQLQTAAEKSELSRGEAKFYLAKDFTRPSEQQFARSLELFQQLAAEYPHNPLWPLLVGSVQLRLDHPREGEKLYREALDMTRGKNTEVMQALHSAALKALERRNPNEKFE